MTITIGIDAHKRTHTMVAVDRSGLVLSTKTFLAMTPGHLDALQWAGGLPDDGDVLWAVEDCRLYTRLLEQDLLKARQRVVRVPTVMMAHSRKSARTAGKSDPIDATAVARAALRDPDLPAALHDDASWELKLLMDRRDDVVRQRVAATNRMIQRLHLIDPAIPKPKNLSRAPQRDALRARLKTLQGLNVELAREELHDIDRFSLNVNELTSKIGSRVRAAGSTLTDIPGCGVLTAARLICDTVNVKRFRNEAAFASYVGVAPQPAWSGSTRGRMRLSRSGNRQLNSALHTIATTQIRLDGPGRAYYQRRIQAGDTKAGARRCLKRKICRVVYRHLILDYRSNHPPLADTPDLDARTHG